MSNELFLLALLSSLRRRQILQQGFVVRVNLSLRNLTQVAVSIRELQLASLVENFQEKAHVVVTDELVSHHLIAVVNMHAVTLQLQFLHQ